jgi:hypothetical protein
VIVTPVIQFLRFGLIGMWGLAKHPWVEHPDCTWGCEA